MGRYFNELESTSYTITEVSDEAYDFDVEEKVVFLCDVEDRLEEICNNIDSARTAIDEENIEECEKILNELFYDL